MRHVKLVVLFVLLLCGRVRLEGWPVECQNWRFYSEYPASLYFVLHVTIKSV